MRLYLDTALSLSFTWKKRAHPSFEKCVEAADTAATSIVAFVEARAAFARRRREKRIPPAAHAKLVRDFEADWDRYLVLEVTAPLIRRAGKLTEVHPLRAYDAIHLACARILRERLAERVSFASWDARLVSAAREEGLEVVALQ